MLACGVGTAAARFDCANMTPPPYPIPAARPILFWPMFSAPEARPHEREVTGIFLRADDRRRVTVAAIRRRPPEAGAAVQRHARRFWRGWFRFGLRCRGGWPLGCLWLFCHDDLSSSCWCECSWNENARLLQPGRLRHASSADAFDVVLIESRLFA